MLIKRVSKSYKTICQSEQSIESKSLFQAWLLFDLACFNYFTLSFCLEFVSHTSCLQTVKNVHDKCFNALIEDLMRLGKAEKSSWIQILCW